MGKGIDAARLAGAGLHADVMDDFRDQLLVALLARHGPEVRVPVAEVDATGQFVVLMAVVDGVFVFNVEKKQ